MRGGVYTTRAGLAFGGELRVEVFPRLALLGRVRIAGVESTKTTSTHEYVEVLARLGLSDSPELVELLKLFATGFHIVFTTRTPEIHVVTDPDDDKFIACALALKAGYVVTGDKALVDVQQYQGIKIVTPREFLEIIRGLKP